MKTTDCMIYHGGEPTKADAHGNNVAWACSVCGYPILFVCLESQKGYDGRLTKCKGCGESFTIQSKSEKSMVIEAAR